jgi:hypothetical protein
MISRVKIHQNRIYGYFEVKEWRVDTFIGVAEGWYTITDAPVFQDYALALIWLNRHKPQATIDEEND